MNTHDENFTFEDIAPTDQQEDENDLDQNIDYRNAVVMNADWTIGTIYQQVSRENIVLDPTFQRREAWDDTRKSRLIESIIVGVPIPNIVLAEAKENRGHFMVIDGKQRLLAVMTFMSGNLTLRGLDLRQDLNGLNFSSLPFQDRDYFENSTIRATIVRNWQDENFLYAMFYRLNSGSLQLSPQELRKALVGGKLLDAIDEYIFHSDAFKSVFGEKLDKRMRDSELVLRFIAFDSDIEHYNGNLKHFLDEATKKYESNWSALSQDLIKKFDRLNLALETSYTIFGSNAFKKYSEKGYERRINRAIFDSVARSFSEPHVSQWAIENPQEVITLYEEVCLDPDFRSAIEKTTKTREATFARIHLWGKKIADAMGAKYEEASARIR
ncbi:DUF262 domain-containing protein [Pseudomonas sp. BMW13]|uniref:GmrSD restriction endonuclease domain-containing protein n=1 Tax=Pseudomonas sp. BMW13 TaxID=2562590 RepID=UPI00158378A6|nr:DUF262 domain-containing protein [Pseudomonas sp. BMW13]